MSRRVRICVVLLVIIAATGGLAAAAEEYSARYRAKVQEANSLEEGNYSEEEWEIQFVRLRLLSGPQKNENITILNTLTGHPFFDLRVKKGDRVIVQADLSQTPTEYFLVDFARGGPLAVVTILFILAVIVIGGRQGIKAVISLAAMGVVIGAVILPLVLKGYNPVLVTVGLASLLTGFFVLFIGGYSRKTAAAVCGTVGGLLASGVLALIAGRAGYLSGLSSEEAQILQYLDSSIDFRGLLFSGIIIGALGAILDVGISIASAMEQIKAADPTTDFKTLFTRGILVGRDLIATMSNTLILAYVGSALPLLLLFQVGEKSWSEVLNLDLVASEVVRAMAGSIGLTLAIPITAFVSAFLFVKPQDKSQDLGC